MINNQMIVILGPTASGKTELAVSLALKLNAEIISADSRQIYKGMDIGTGKDLDAYKIRGQFVPYHLIDILDPSIDYSVYQFKKDFFKTYYDLQGENKRAILCGGTGLYIESILLNYNMPNVGPNIKLRSSFEKKSKNELIDNLKKIDKASYDPSYHTTKRRIIRTIEIITSPHLNTKKKEKINKRINTYYVIGIKIEREILLNRIKKRLNKRLESGMIEEVETLIKEGVPFSRLKYFGLEYRIVGEHLSNQLNFNDMKQKLNYAINRFSKRQMTFFRRMEKRGIKINWVENNSLDNIKLFIPED